ncbi:unnamed protein product [Oreochromis niloticus]|nr:unnamed protein product [Mustela putorius furo]
MSEQDLRGAATEAAGVADDEHQREMERTKRKRGTIRGATTRLVHQIDSEMAKPDPDTDHLSTLLEMLSAKELSLYALDSEIERKTALDDLEMEIESAEEYKERIILSKSRARRIIKRTEDCRERAAHQRVSDASSSHSSAQRASVKLPKLIIHKYDGDASLWQEFWSQYEAVIHHNDALCKREKFTYLKTYLTGQAAKAVAGLMLTDENYDNAIELLQNRFGRKDVVISAHMSKLLNLTPVKKSSDVHALRQLYDECEIQIRSLESLGVVSESYGSLLCPILLKMIPDDIALEYSRQRNGDEEWKVSEMVTFLQKEVQSRERALQMTKSYNPQKTENKLYKPPFSDVRFKRPSIQATAALYTASQKQNTCIFCECEDHKSENCPNNDTLQRKDKLRRMGRCFVCLGQKHIARFCKIKNVSCEKCGRRHHVAVCSGERVDVQAPSQPEEAVVSSVLPHSARVKPGEQNTVLLQTAKVWIEGPSGRRVARCLLDGGSQRSFIHETLVKSLNLPVIRQETLTLHTFGSSFPTRSQRSIVKVMLQNIWDPSQSIVIEAVETPQVCSAIMKVPGEQIQHELKKRRLQLADFPGSNEEPELAILIGADYYWQIVTGRVERLTETLVALESTFGWSVQGPVSASTVTEATCMFIPCEEEQLLSKQLKAFWEIESLGITNEKTKNPEDDEALQMFERTTMFKDGRYQVELPWRPERVELSDNYRVAKKRLEGLSKRSKKDVTLFSRYNQVVEDYLDQNIAEEVTPNSDTDSVMYYMPHHAVLREDKATTKLRVVFDASSHEEGCLSLNDCLFTGPNLNPDLLSVLLRFREHEIAFLADIKQAFLQIRLAERDRDAVRFLWFSGAPRGEVNDHLRILRMTRVVFGVTPSPFLLAATIQRHLKQYETSQPQVVNTIRESLYVDDFISSTRTVEEAYLITTNAKEILAAAGMELCKWMTNSAELRQKWEKSSTNFMMAPETNAVALKVLGLVWRPDPDDFTFDLSSLVRLLTEKKGTKRSVLQSSARIYDPLGFLNPFTIRVKCMFQAMWERGLSWDEELPPDLAQEWQQWCSELTQLHQLAIPRWYQINMQQESKDGLELHVFCDASERAYSAVAYLQGKTREGETTMSLVASKVRVAPLKKMTLPRLELMGAVIGARLANNLIISLKMEQAQIKMWTDSMITLQWICSSAQRWKPFVANRVTEIQTLTSPSSWSHVPGKANPADLPTRGQSVEALLQNQLWWNGPSFLVSEDRIHESEDQNISDEMNVELKSSHQVAIHFAANDICEPILKLESYSKLKRVLRVTAWIRRFIANAKTTMRPKMQGELTANELLDAEKYWIKVAQRHSFHQEVQRLKIGKPMMNDSRIQELKPFLDEDELLSVGGRLQQSDFTFREQHPWILPNKHRFSELLIQDCHTRVMHSGVRDTLVQIRERYWIIRARQLVKNIVTRCTVCKRFKAKAGRQLTAPLPRDRISESPPFEVTGVDFAGPLYVKTEDSVKRSYIALFTCAVTRAVHLELVSDQSTETFLLALKRFIARRGLCRVIYSDNARTFKRADQDLKELWKTIKDPHLLEFFSERGITWKFIAERAAWWGGFWERLVRSVKICLKKVLGRASLHFEEMCTVLAEVEATLNSRPLTFVHNEVNEPQPLTPAHFLVGKRLTSLPPKSIPKDTHHPTANKEDITRRWRYRQKLMTNFWNTWRRDYLLELRSAHRCDASKPTPLKLGDVVLIGHDNLPRQVWKLGRIEEMFPGRDGLVRSCLVRTTTGTLLRRPIQLLYNLEL